MKIGIPRHAEPIADDAGMVTRVWYAWLRDIWNAIGLGRMPIYADLFVPASSMRPLSETIRDAALSPWLAASDITHGLGMAPHGWRIIRSDAPACSVSVYSAAGQSNIGSHAYTKIQFDSEDHDIGGDFDSTTNYRFTAPVDGIYDANASVVVGGMTDGKLLIGKFYLNGSASRHFGQTIQGGAGTAQVTGPARYRLSAGDTLDLRVYQDTGSTLATGAGSGFSRFDVHADTSIVDAQDELSAGDQEDTLRLRSACECTVDLEIFTVLDDGAIVGGLRTRRMPAGIDTPAVFEVRLPNDYRPGTDLRLFVEWAPVDGSAGNVVFSVEHAGAASGETMPASSTESKTVASPASAAMVERTEFSDIDGAAFVKGTVVCVRIARAGTDAGDTYADDISILGVGIKYQREGIGWESEYP